jgi:molybdate transport system regulatory protein
MAETQVSIRIDLESGGRIGPGKIALLEAIRKTGSITAAAQSMQMSYARAWRLVDELNKLLSEPVVTTTAGGFTRGGATLTPVGEKTIALYHSIEAQTRSAARSEFQAFQKLMRG